MKTLTFEEVRKQCLLGRSTLRRLVGEGKFPSPTADGVWKQSDVSRWLRQHNEVTEAPAEPEPEAVEEETQSDPETESFYQTEDE